MLIPAGILKRNNSIFVAIKEQNQIMTSVWVQLGRVMRENVFEERSNVRNVHEDLAWYAATPKEMFSSKPIGKMSVYSIYICALGATFSEPDGWQCTS